MKVLGWYVWVMEEGNPVQVGWASTKAKAQKMMTDYKGAWLTPEKG